MLCIRVNTVHGQQRRLLTQERLRLFLTARVHSMWSNLVTKPNVDQDLFKDFGQHKTN